MDALTLDGKVAVVTGATSGIGREICLRFARAGAQVVAAGRRTATGAEVTAAISAAGGTARFVATDVTDPAQVARLIAAAEEAHGQVNTPMLRDWIAAAPDPETLERDQLRPVPLGRFGRANEIAEAALFLASDASSFLAGSIVVADGGATAWYGL